MIMKELSIESQKYIKTLKDLCTEVSDKTDAVAGVEYSQSSGLLFVFAQPREEGLLGIDNIFGMLINMASPSKTHDAEKAEAIEYIRGLL